MRIGLIADTHLGVRDDDEKFFPYYQDIFDYFLEICLEKEVDFAVHLGDILHHRKKVGTNTISFTNKLVDKIQKKVKFYVIAGNHDFRFKDSPKVCSFSELKFSNFSNVIPITSPKVEKIKDNLCLFLPWPEVFPEEDIQKLLNQKYDYVFGHFSVIDFQLTKQRKELSGFVPSEISKMAKKIFLGHLHIPQEYKNIIYVGSPLHLTRNDVNQNKRFLIFDTETEEATEYQTNHLFPNFLKIYSFNELKDFHVKNSNLEFYLPINKAEKITTKEYEKLIFLLRQVGASKIKIKIFDENQGKHFEDFNEPKNNLILSIKDIILQLIIKEAQIREINLSNKELQNYIKILYDLTDNSSLKYEKTN